MKTLTDHAGRNDRRLPAVLLLFAVLSLFIGAGTEAFPTAAEDISADCTLSLSGKGGEDKALDSGRLLDADYTTYVSLSGEDRLKISSEKAFASIYIIWNKIPGEWTLSAAYFPHARTVRLSS